MQMPLPIHSVDKILIEGSELSKLCKIRGPIRALHFFGKYHRWFLNPVLEALKYLSQKLSAWSETKDDHIPVKISHPQVAACLFLAPVAEEATEKRIEPFLEDRKALAFKILGRLCGGWCGR